MKIATRFTALLLCLSLLLGGIPLVSGAEEETARLEGMDLAYESTNGFGELLAAELRSAETVNEDPTWISEILVEDGTVFIDLAVEKDALLLVAAYDEGTGELVTSATVEADSLDTTVSVVMEDLPSYFEMKVFVLDRESYEPLCGAYTSTYYTRAIQDLVSKTVADFPEEQVLNLDNDDSKNFAVYAGEVVQVEESMYNNHLLSTTGGVYRFESPDQTMQSLSAGQILAYTTLSGKLYIIKVAKVSGNSRNFGITPDENVQIEEVFDYVKIDTAMDTSSATVNDSDMDDGVTFDGVQAPGTRAFHGELSHESTFLFGMRDKEIVEGVKLSFTLGLTFGADLEYYLAVGENSFVRLGLSYKLEAQFSVEAELAEKAIKLAEIVVVPIFGVKFLVRPYFVFSAKAKVSASLTYASSGGYVVSVRGGRISGQKLYTKPKLESQVEVEGTIFVGLKMVPAIHIITDGLADVDMEFTAGIELNAKTVGLKCDPYNEDHQCQLCIDGVLKVKAQIDIKLRMLYVFYLDVNLLKYERYLADFYYSFDLNEFGFGICPNDKGSMHSLISGQNCTAAGSCGDLKWFFYDNGTLYINGTGIMKTPDEWEDLADKVLYVIIESGAENISEKAFYGFSKLDSIQIPETVTLIDDYALCGCESLMELELPDGLVSLGAYAIGHCDSLSSVTVGSQLESVGNCAFRRCYALTGISLPTGLETLGTRVFEECTSLEYADLPCTLVTMGDAVFQNCSRLQEIWLPDSLEEMGKDCFYFCTGLTSAYVPGGIGSLPETCFYGCEALETIELAEGITAIGKAAFWDCKALTNVYLPNTVKKLEQYAFMNCEGIRYISLGNGLTEIGGEAFRRCYGLTSIRMPDTVTSLGLRAFEACGSLEQVVLSESLETVGRMSFYECSALESITIPDSVTCIEEDAFAYCTALRTVRLGEGVQTMEDAAFYYCESLEEISFNDALETIGDGAFWFCQSLTAVDLPDGLLELGAYAFQSCENLSTIDLGNSLQLLGGWSLKNTAVTSVTVPATVTTVGNCAFSYCDMLSSVTFMGDAPSFGRQTFEETETVAYYPSNRNGWTEEIRQDYAGAVTWVAFTAPTSVSAPALRSRMGKASSKEVTGLSNSARYLLVLARSESEPVLGGDNLLYVAQLLTNHRGELSLAWTLPTGVEAGYGALYGEDGITVLWQGGQTPPDIPISNPFADVKEADYFYTPVLWAVEQGITTGTSATTFSPNDPCTRGQIVTFLWRASGSPEPTKMENPFRDVSANMYYYKAVLWAVEQGITTGTSSTTFSPEDTCTRGQVATFLWRACGKPKPASSNNPFSDVSSSQYYYEPILWAVEQGVTNGTGNGKFSPEDSCTRGQIVTFLYRALAE